MTESTDMQLLSKLLGNAGWRDVDVSKCDSVGHLNCAFVSEYALLGIVFSRSTQEVLGCWADSQVALMRIAEEDALSHLKDHYLVFFVKDIEDSDREELRRVTDDKHECRKTCIETRGRTLDSVLAELPFVSGVAAESQSVLDNDDEPDSELAAAGLTSTLLDDLGKRSASTILKRWLQSKYGRETDTDAPEEH